MSDNRECELPSASLRGAMSLLGAVSGRLWSRLWPVALLSLLAVSCWVSDEAPQAANLIPLNLDFSRPSLADPEMPWGWWFLPMRSSGVAVNLVDEAGGGGKALRLERAEDGPAVQGIYDLIEPFSGHRVAVEAPLQRGPESAASIRVGLVAYGEEGVLAESWSEPQGEVRRAALDVGDETTSLQVVLEYAGSGTVTLSPLNLQIDGKPLASSVLPGQKPPSEADVAWVRRHAMPLRTTEPTPPFDDLAALRPMIGDATFVLLGESTHSSHEFFTLKHRIVRWLMEQEGFTVFAIEDHASVAAAIDRYVNTGEGDIVEVVEGLFGVWERNEVLEMVRWMREAVAAGSARITFAGFDLQNPLGAIAALTAFAAAEDPPLGDAIERDLGAMRDAWQARSYPQRTPEEHEEWAAGAQRFVDTLIRRSDGYHERIDAETMARVRFNARLAWQAAELSRSNDSALRDRYMAENLSWFHDQQPPGSRIVVWAHNAHIRLDEDRMGRFLARRHPGEVVAMGLTTYQGTYTAYNGSSMETYTLFPGPPASIEQILHESGQPILALDLRQPDADDTPSPFRTLRYHRNIGLFPADFGFYRAVVADAFDVLIYVDATTASRPLGACAAESCPAAKAVSAAQIRADFRYVAHYAPQIWREFWLAAPLSRDGRFYRAGS